MVYFDKIVLFVHFSNPVSSQFLPDASILVSAIDIKHDDSPNKMSSPDISLTRQQVIGDNPGKMRIFYGCILYKT
jgi:hypothetical protein